VPEINRADVPADQLDSGRVDWADGDGTSKTVVVRVLGDAAIEPDETITMQLLSPVGCTIRPIAQSATATVLNDDSPAVSVVSVAAPASAAEGDTGQVTFNFTVTRSNGTNGAIQVKTTCCNRSRHGLLVRRRRKIPYARARGMRGSDAEAADRRYQVSASDHYHMVDYIARTPQYLALNKNDHSKARENVCKDVEKVCGNDFKVV
jgi:hypothetical protein